MVLNLASPARLLASPTLLATRVGLSPKKQRYELVERQADCERLAVLADAHRAATVD